MLSFWYFRLRFSHRIRIWLPRKQRLYFGLPAPVFQNGKPPTKSRIPQSTPPATRGPRINFWFPIV